jgi:LemA protein
MTVAILVIVALIVVIGVGWLASYNRFVRQRALVGEAWRDVDVELRRRHDLVPNLVRTVTSYAAHERSVVDSVLAARERAVAPGSPVPQQSAQESELSASLGRLLALAEAYPQLRASEQFAQLAWQLAGTEDRIAAARRFYNGNVRAYNTRLATFPSSFVARVAHFGPAEFFEVTELAARQPVDVRFDELPSGSGGERQKPPLP